MSVYFLEKTEIGGGLWEISIFTREDPETGGTGLMSGPFCFANINVCEDFYDLLGTYLKKIEKRNSNPAVFEKFMDLIGYLTCIKIHRDYPDGWQKRWKSMKSSF